MPIGGGWGVSLGPSSPGTSNTILTGLAAFDTGLVIYTLYNSYAQGTSDMPSASAVGPAVESMPLPQEAKIKVTSTPASTHRPAVYLPTPASVQRSIGNILTTPYAGNSGVNICSTPYAVPARIGIWFTGKSVDDILEGSIPGRVTKGRSSQYIKTGGYSQALNDFYSLNPSGIRDIPSGKVGTLPDGRTINVRTGSSYLTPTLEIIKGKARIKIRYYK